MNSSCNICTVKGDFAKCSNAKCDLHESWYAIRLKTQRDQFSRQLDESNRMIAQLQDQLERAKKGVFVTT